MHAIAHRVESMTSITARGAGYLRDLPYRSWATRKPSRTRDGARLRQVPSQDDHLDAGQYDHLSPRYRPQPGIVRCIDCHTTNTEMMIPSLSRPAGRRRYRADRAATSGHRK